jgi:hypothetical protein
MIHRGLLWTAILGGFLLPASAQHNHDAGHPDYRLWKSLRAPASCCNEHDCSSVKESEHRETDTGPELLIGGQWCPVQQRHRLIGPPRSRQSPDWSVPHACIQPGPPEGGCERLLCYQGAGGF